MKNELQQTFVIKVIRINGKKENELGNKYISKYRINSQ
jgi:hypothetical protein